MRQLHSTFRVETDGPGLTDITHRVREWLATTFIQEGLLTLFIRHTSASLVVQENADPDVLADLEAFFADIAPRTRAYRHQSEGSDDMPAHIRSALTQTSLSVPVIGGRLALGTWQGLYLFEHRDQPHEREIVSYMSGI